MIYFEIDGVEYTASISDEPTQPCVPFTGPDGTTLYMHAPERVEGPQ